MKNIKVLIKDEILITNRHVDKCYKNIEKLVIGREDIDEIRSYITTDFEEGLINNNIVKIELSLYLEDIDLKSSSDCFMLNIGTIFNGLAKDNISWNNPPKFYQESLLYKINENNKKKYIRLDVTTIYKKYIRKGKIPKGFMLLCFNANAIVSFASTKTSKGGFITIYYNEQQNIEDQNKKELLEDINEVKEERGYGQFYSKSGNLRKEKDKWVIKLEQSINTKGIKLDKESGHILLNKLGKYKVEYSLNCRCNDISIMGLELDNIILEQSMIQVGNNEGVTTGSCIINIKNRGSLLKFIIFGNDIVALDIGIAANVTIVQI